MKDIEDATPNARKNVLLLFAKLPQPGQTKTRLSVLKDGVFSAEDAAELFGCMLLDVVEIALTAFEKLTGDASSMRESIRESMREVRQSYELVISTAPASNVDAMRKFLSAEFGSLDEMAFPIRIISDSGHSFDEHYNDAFEKTWESGADCILSMGADMPALTVDDIVRGFTYLHTIDDEERKAIVVAPDQEMGVSVIGWNSSLDFDHSGIYYNPTGLTVLPAYIDKAKTYGIDAIWLPPIPDVDTIADLVHNMTLMDAQSYCAECDLRNGDKHTAWAHRTSAKLKELGCEMVRIPPNELHDPRDVIDSE